MTNITYESKENEAKNLQKSRLSGFSQPMNTPKRLKLDISPNDFRTSSDRKYLAGNSTIEERSQEGFQIEQSSEPPDIDTHKQSHVSIIKPGFLIGHNAKLQPYDYGYASQLKHQGKLRKAFLKDMPKN